jgi:hypothetical protein
MFKKISKRQRRANGQREKGKVMDRVGESEALYGMERKKGLKRGIENGEKEKRKQQE